MKKGKRIVLLALLLLCGAGGFAAYRLHKTGVPAEISPAVRKAVRDSYTEEGVIRAGEAYQVIPEVSGPVAELCVSENQVVHAGDLLFRIDDTEYTYRQQIAGSTLDGYRAQLEQNRIGQVMTATPEEYLASLRKQKDAAEAALRAAQSTYEAYQALYASGDVSRTDFEQAEAAFQAAQTDAAETGSRYSSANEALKSLKDAGIEGKALNERFYGSDTERLEAQIRAAETELQHLTEQVEKCRVRADRDGIIAELPVKQLSAVAAGQPAAVIRESGGSHVETDILTSAAPYLKVGMPAEIRLRLRGKDEQYEGRISEIYDYAEKGVSALGVDEFLVHVIVEPLEDSFGPVSREGYGVNVTFPLYDAEDALTVPAGAVFESDGQDYVYTVREGTAVKTPVEILYRTTGDAVIGSGLGEGETVIRRADTEKVYDGVKIREQ